VFGPLLLALLILMILEIVGYFVLHRVGRQPHLRPLANATLQLLRLVASGLSCFFAFLVIALPLRPSIEPPEVIGVALAFLVAPTVYGIIRISRTGEQLRRVGALPKGYTGLLYRNPEDPRLWVPKLVGPGMTINFAHRWAWPLLLALVAGTFILAAFIARLVAHQ
jgi:uncharacterized membrane protein